MFTEAWKRFPDFAEFLQNPLVLAAFGVFVFASFVPFIRKNRLALWLSFALTIVLFGLAGYGLHTDVEQLETKLKESEKNLSEEKQKREQTEKALQDYIGASEARKMQRSTE